MSKDKKNASDNLKELLGDKLFKKGGAGAEIFAEAKKKIQKEKDEENLKKIEEHIRKALDSESQMEQKRKEFNKVEEKHQKELGKVVNQLRQMAGQNDAKSSEDENNS